MEAGKSVTVASPTVVDPTGLRRVAVLIVEEIELICTEKGSCRTTLPDAGTYGRVFVIWTAVWFDQEAMLVAWLPMLRLSVNTKTAALRETMLCRERMGQVMLRVFCCVYAVECMPLRVSCQV